jgi:hypothetical protein
MKLKITIACAVLGGVTAFSQSPKQIIHEQSFSNSSMVSNVVSNHSYIDTLPFDGIVLRFPDYEDVFGPNYVANYSNLWSQIGPIKGVLQKVTHNYLLVLIGNSGMPDPFDDWTQEINNWVILAQVARDAGLEGILLDNEEYNVHKWQHPDNCKYASTRTLSQYQEQWRMRGNQVSSAVLAQWPAFRCMHSIGPNRSENGRPPGARFGGNDHWLGGYFFMGMFAGAPGQIIDGGEAYYLRTPNQFANWRNFEVYTLTRPPKSPPLIPSSLFSTWTAQHNQSFGFYDQDTVGSPAMSPSVLQQVILNALPYADSFVWNYDENLNWLTPTVDSNWVTAIWSARHVAGIPDPGTSPSGAFH